MIFLERLMIISSQISRMPVTLDHQDRPSSYVPLSNSLLSTSWSCAARRNEPIQGAPKVGFHFEYFVLLLSFTLTALNELV